MDQSATNQLIGNAAGVELWPPLSMEGIPIVLSPNSTGEFVVQACLKSQGFQLEDVAFINEPQQAGVIEAMTPIADPAPELPVPAAKPERPLAEIAKLHQRILDQLGPSPVGEDQLIRDLGATSRAVSPVLTDLELDGRVHRHPGGLISRVS